MGAPLPHTPTRRHRVRRAGESTGRPDMGGASDVPDDARDNGEVSERLDCTRSLRRCGARARRACGAGMPWLSRRGPCDEALRVGRFYRSRTTRRRIAALGHLAPTGRAASFSRATLPADLIVEVIDAARSRIGSFSPDILDHYKRVNRAVPIADRRGVIEYTGRDRMCDSAPAGLRGDVAIGLGAADYRSRVSPRRGTAGRGPSDRNTSSPRGPTPIRSERR
jgi:hypothetical protein